MVTKFQIHKLFAMALIVILFAGLFTQGGVLSVQAAEESTAVSSPVFEEDGTVTVQTVSTKSEMYINGNFADWKAFRPMTATGSVYVDDVEQNVFSYKLTTEDLNHTGGVVQYKFVPQAAWSGGDYADPLNGSPTIGGNSAVYFLKLNAEQKQLRPGQNSVVEAFRYKADGSKVDLTDDVEWTSSKPLDVKVVDGMLLVAPETSVGSVTLTAAYQGVTATLALVIVNSVADLVMTPGRDATELNFTWVPTNTSSTSASRVQIAKKNDMTTAAFPDMHETFTGTLAVGTDALASNKVTVTGLQESTEYVYRVSDGEEWSSVYSFTTHESAAYDFLLYGDPQIGASSSENVAGDTTGWQDTLTKSIYKYPNASFLMSVGDQVNVADNEVQYSGFFSPAELKRYPLATVSGNHDNNINYMKHYNQPNESTDYGITDAGGDYYFTHGNTLYMMLNTNNNVGTGHKAFMQEAIAATPNATWKVVMFHHSIYSAANHSTEGYITDLRASLTKVFDELDIDVVLMGHDHSYVRTYQMENDVPKKDQQLNENGDVVNPTGTLYVTVNSASGSKYYDLKAVPEPYSAKREQFYAPSFSHVSVTNQSLSISTYKIDPATDVMTEVDSYTIRKGTSNAAVPAAPTGLKASAGKSSGITLTWNATAESTGYNIYRSKAGSEDFVLCNTVPVTELSYLDDNLSASTTYSYKVTAVNGAGESVASDVVSATTPTPTVAPIPEPIVVSTTVPTKTPIPSPAVSSTAAPIVTPTITPAPANPSFSDVAGKYDWAQQAIEELASKGIIKGISATSFGPGKAIRRADFILLLVKGLELQGQANSNFTDVAANAYYSEAIAIAKGNDIISGMGNNQFLPSAEITREDLMVMVARALQKSGKIKITLSVHELDEFKDASKVSAYAKASIAAILREEIITGSGNGMLNPKQSATRAEAAVIIYNLMKKYME
ncbi:S-layer homology domain-containing protein [Paenibacillus sp. 19GGS1-52]|uniref:S-layer homology domain-containing protein n=1 Tax=Paenibacillus sp. 19GGS1-52 TaxID=2758563 RepID=UPI001EFAA296|nr:S-layer homology domain-containing protein [Paenibacillus sp. 19GGS1-52]ULO06858.1 S-layer homology domain-containing protein [Paenibacillus sp. 19GGS1-52]